MSDLGHIMWHAILKKDTQKRVCNIPIPEKKEHPSFVVLLYPTVPGSPPPKKEAERSFLKTTAEEEEPKRIVFYSSFFGG